MILSAKLSGVNLENLEKEVQCSFDWYILTCNKVNNTEAVNLFVSVMASLTLLKQLPKLSEQKTRGEISLNIQKKRKDNLEDSLDRVVFVAELEFPKILVPKLP